MSQALHFSTVDVFTMKAFCGNQLAIIHVPKHAPLSQATKQAIAREFNFSESVFLHDAEPDSTDRQLDIFTTKDELPFAGHPTIGALVYVCQSASPPLERVRLITKAGPINGRFDAKSEMAEAEIPHNVHIHTTLVPRAAIMTSQPTINVQDDTETTFPQQLPLVSIVKGMSFILVQLHQDDLEKLNGQSQKIAKGLVELDESWSPSFVGVYYYTLDNTHVVHRIRARMLEECMGEDPATGSAASCLAAYLALQAGLDYVVYEFDIEQGKEMGRASCINVKVQLAVGGKEVRKVVLGGSAVPVTEGKLHVPPNA